MKILSLILATLALASNLIAATGDMHVSLENSDGSTHEVRVTLPAGSAVTVDTNGNPVGIVIPASVIPPHAQDIVVTTGSLIAGTGAQVGKFTLAVTFTTAFGTGVVPEVQIITHGLASYGDAINITNTGFTLVLPISVGGTFGMIAAAKL